MADLEKVKAALLLIGSNVRMEQPLAGHRLRKAALAGGKLMFVNPRDFEFRFPVAAKIIADPAGMVAALAGVAGAVAELKGEPLPDGWAGLAAGAPSETERAIAANLIDNAPATVLLGNLATAHPAFAQLRALAGFVALRSGAATRLSAGSRQFGGRLAGRSGAAPPAGRREVRDGRAGRAGDAGIAAQGLRAGRGRTGTGLLERRGGAERPARRGTGWSRSASYASVARATRG